MTIQEVLSKSIDFLKKKNIESAKLDSELLISDALKIKRLDLYLKFDRPLAETELVVCRERIRQRGLGVPVSIVLGQRDFWGLTFLVNSHVLTPRSETEELVEKAVEFFKSQFSVETRTRRPVILDLGAGSGCIGLTFLKKVSANIPVQIWMIEKSPQAFQVLLANVNKICEKDIQQKQQVSEGRWEFVLSGERSLICVCESADEPTKILPQEESFQVDLLLSNPPYIAANDSAVAPDVLQYEPHEALFAEENGLQKLKLWSEKYQSYLAPGALCLMEMGHLHGEEMRQHFMNHHFSEVQVLQDLQGRDRLIKGLKV